jgi:hypothetical protein
VRLRNIIEFQLDEIFLEQNTPVTISNMSGFNSDNNTTNNSSSSSSNNTDQTWGEWAWDWASYFLKEAAIYGGTMVLSKFIVDLVQQSNPTLNNEQAHSLDKLLNQIVHRYRRGQDVQYQLRAILALICPEDRDMEALYEALISGNVLDTAQWTFTMGGSGMSDLTPEQRAERTMPAEVDLSTMKVEDEISDILINTYGVSEERVLLLPHELRQVLVETLATKPTCPISMDELIMEDGKLKQGVTALFQYTNNAPHCFLFDSETIDGWVGENNTNPVTRQTISRKEYFVLN